MLVLFKWVSKFVKTRNKRKLKISQEPAGSAVFCQWVIYMPLQPSKVGIMLRLSVTVHWNSKPQIRPICLKNRQKAEPEINRVFVTVTRVFSHNVESFLQQFSGYFQNPHRSHQIFDWSSIRSNYDVLSPCALITLRRLIVNLCSLFIQCLEFNPVATAEVRCYALISDKTLKVWAKSG